MASAAVDGALLPEQTETAPSVPDYMLDPNAIVKDNVTWRYGKSPDYSNTRRIYQETKKCSHAPGSLESMVENLVKNWEIEASHKMKVSEWRTVDPERYTFAINGGPPQDAEHMLKVGTYNAIIAAPNQYYDAKHSDFEKSHKTFREMMPVFTWEVLEVYSPPPTVAFRWRHWGEMKSDYVGWNNKGEKITLQAHSGSLDIQGLTIAKLNDKMQVTSLETWFDPLEMFNQMVPKDETTESSKAGTNITKLAENDNETTTTPATDQQASNGDHTNASTPSLVAQIEPEESLAAENGIGIHNSTIPTNGHAEEETKEPPKATEDREGGEGQPQQTEKKAYVIDAGVSTIAGSGCPFLDGQQ